MSLGEVVQTYRPGDGPIMSIDCNPNSNLLAVAQLSGDNESATLSLIDLATGKTSSVIEKSHEGENSVWKVKFNATGSRLIYIDQPLENFQLVSYDLSANEKSVIKEADDLEELNGYTINPVNSFLVLPTRENILEFWDLDSQDLVKKIGIQESLEPVSIDASIIVSFSHDGKYLALGGMQENTISIYTTDDFTLKQQLKATFSFPGQILFDGDDELVVVADYWQKGVFVWDLKSGERYLENIFYERKSKVRCVALSPDNQFIAFGYTSSFVVVFDLQTGDTVFEDKLHEGRVHDICFTADGKKLISAGEDWKIIVRSME